MFLNGSCTQVGTVNVLNIAREYKDWKDEIEAARDKLLSKICKTLNPKPPIVDTVPTLQ